MGSLTGVVPTTALTLDNKPACQGNYHGQSASDFRKKFDSSKNTVLAKIEYYSLDAPNQSSCNLLSDCAQIQGTAKRKSNLQFSFHYQLCNLGKLPPLLLYLHLQNGKTLDTSLRHTLLRDLGSRYCPKCFNYTYNSILTTQGRHHH